MDPSLQDFIHELATASIVGLFDPKPIGWTAQHERDVRRVRRAVGAATDQTLAGFKTPVNRNGFLLGCLDLTEHEPIEHLIVGYGLRSGSTTKLHSVHHAVGTAHQVQLSDAMVSELTLHAAADSRGEAVIFHNHARNDFNHLFDNLPLASNTDRKTWKTWLLTWFKSAGVSPARGVSCSTSAKTDTCVNSVGHSSRRF